MSFNLKDMKCFARPPKFQNRMVMVLLCLSAAGCGIYVCRAWFIAIRRASVYYLRTCEKDFFQGCAHDLVHQLYGCRLSAWRGCRDCYGSCRLFPRTDYHMGTEKNWRSLLYK